MFPPLPPAAPFLPFFAAEFVALKQNKNNPKLETSALSPISGAERRVGVALPGPDLPFLPEVSTVGTISSSLASLSRSWFGFDFFSSFKQGEVPMFLLEKRLLSALPWVSEGAGKSKAGL